MKNQIDIIVSNLDDYPEYRRELEELAAQVDREIGNGILITGPMTFEEFVELLNR